MLSLLIPVYNEQGAVEQTIRTAHRVLSEAADAFEIVVINDGSTDGTTEILRNLHLEHVHIVTHPQNRGYGASLKTGIRRSRGELIAMTDADGTYPVTDLPYLLQRMRAAEADMVVGARTKKGVKIPLIRRPAKAIVGWLANSLTGMTIPDVNSGLRIFTRDLGERYMHLYPQRFSFTITITLAALTSDYVVVFEPITYGERTGTSTMSSGTNGLKNFARFLGLIIRILTYFRPLKFFAWPSVLLMLGGLIMITYTIWSERNISDSGMLMLFTGLQIGLFGLLAEVVVRSRGGGGERK